MVCGIDVWKLLSDEYGDYNVFFMVTGHGVFLPVDGWLIFDGLRYTCFFDVTSNAWKLLDDYGDYSEIRDSCVRPVTRFSIRFRVWREEYADDVQYTIRMILSQFFLRAARHPADSDGPLAMVSLVLWHPYHSGPALHCRVPSRSERCLFS